MAKAPPPELVERSPMAIAASSKVAHHHHHHQRPTSTNSMSSSFFSPKLSIYILSACVALFVIFHIQSLQTPLDSISSLPSWSLNNVMRRQWQRVDNNTTTTAEEENNHTDSLNSLRDRLRQSVTFLPLKDLRYAHAALVGHTWFMSSMYDSSDQEGEVQYQHFPSHSSSNRLLCLKGRDSHDGSWNSYALAWPDALPHNATLLTGLSFISYNHYDYDNIWHGLSALMPFVAWHKKHSCANSPERWILYHWGEIRSGMALWLTSLMEATFGGPPLVEVFDGVEEGTAVCFEKAVVMRHNEGGMSRDQRMEVYDLMRCKARAYCKVISSDRRSREIGMTLFMRTGPRSFQNESAVVGIFEKECAKVHGCRLMVAHSNNLTFCDQVKLMSRTDILISPHGAQLTNMFLMDRNSSVMEFFPKGWLKLAGVGQFVYHWIASWSGMRHQGAWRDPNGEICQYSEDDRRCMSLYKNGKIGINETYFSEWGRITLNQVKRRNMEEAGKGVNFTGCICG
ncbi:PREDICTED: uncharacterized protein LOC101296745 isoform X2 [Fragaria vesca subsp. vesca]|uniref:uncharacterized protein LOC101296745 isoform X2 n=1 Tax=Fragaria vesca subsp. vesca TaxID=101020 RepID=UPI0002C2F9A0|nr:PREDICTED: uncharacterized protein LOC101296745 isoform X2 [Fragaria vesca subsp. vesca]